MPAVPSRCDGAPGPCEDDPGVTHGPADEFTAHTVYTLRLRGGHAGMEHAAITLDDANGRGAVSIRSSFGDWAYSWPARNRGPERSLYDMLARCDAGYLTGKFASGDDFDADRTRDAVKVRILRARRDDDLDADDARVDYERACEINDRSTFEEWCRSTKLSEPWDSTHTVPNRAFTHFLECFGKRMRAACRAADRR